MLSRNRLVSIAAAATVFTVLVFAGGPRHQEQETVFPQDGLIRLHVVANSDSRQDQELKREIRDEIVRFIAPRMLSAENIDSARTVAADNLEEVKQIAEREVRTRGGNYPVSVELASFSFPTKHYGPFVLPAGDYEAVRVVIGAGGGSNWWCVLFPPLCFVDMSKAAGPGQAEGNEQIQANSNAIKEEAGTVPEIKGQGSPDTAGGNGPAVEYRFKILEMLQKIK
ncbi:MAG TPA: stage II sporulation protein R [Bacillota bacterium]|nr:stage II sporulation protein R [Bacillota bacterium]